MLPKQSHKAILDKHYRTYPTAAVLDYSFTDTTGDVIFNWETVGDGAQLLMLTWPHHRVSMVDGNFPSTDSLAYLTTKVILYGQISVNTG
jgi:endo-1,3(4)-beta-glucanase